MACRPGAIVVTMAFASLAGTTSLRRYVTCLLSLGKPWPGRPCAAFRASFLIVGPNLLRGHAEHLLHVRHPALLPSLGGPVGPVWQGPSQWTHERPGCSQPAPTDSRAGRRAGGQHAVAA